MRLRGSALLVAAGLAFSGPLEAFPVSGGEKLLSRVYHEGMDAARAQLAHAGRLLGSGEVTEARLWIDRAAHGDPWMAEAWANRAIQAHREGRIAQAALSYRLALALRPELEPARRGLETLELPAESEDPGVLLGIDPARVEAALALSAGLEDHPLTAAVVLELCLGAGGDDSRLRERLAMAYAAAGWSVDALASLEGGAPGEHEALRSALEPGAREQRRRAEDLLDGLDGDLDALPEEALRLSRAVAMRLAGTERNPARARARMLRWLRIRRGLSARLGGLDLPLGGRWYRATLPAGGEGSPPDDLYRLWPGDTQLAAWVLAMPEAGLEGLIASFPGRLLTLGSGDWDLEAEELGALGTPARTGWRPAVLHGAGRMPARIWLVPQGASATLLVGIAGDGGAGEEGTARASAELEVALDGLGETGEIGEGRPPGDRPLLLPVPPDLRSPAAEANEEQEAWRTLDLGPLRLDLPPGVLGRAVGGEHPSPPGLRPETLALFRGAFRDREGEDVRLGDLVTWGYLDLWRSERAADEIREWIEGPGDEGVPASPLRGDPGASWLRGIDYTEAAGPPTGAGAVALARFGEGRFAGSWLAARLRFGDVVAELGLPLAEGERSLAAFWIPTTLRAAGAPPPPPPVDLSAKYEIRFVAADPRDRGLLELKAGDLVAEELRMMVPARWRVALSSRAERGYPVRLRPREGGAVITLERLAGGREIPLEERLETLLERLGLDRGSAEEVESLRRLSRHRASEGLSAEARRTVEGSGNRRLTLRLLRPQLGKADFALVLEAPEEEWSANLEQTAELAFDSLRFRKAGSKGKGKER